MAAQCSAGAVCAWRYHTPREIVPGMRRCFVANARVGSRYLSMLEQSTRRLRLEVSRTGASRSPKCPCPLLKEREHANNRLISY